ncbi:MFS transporter [Clostridium sp.]|uniref:MFS transporter n=1 Tax=Clostridium sp. TaxID=1506 RepID=UPI001A53CFB6|nr:MFS transporter [Clostridium sp.]MBK5236311.1 MFS transporter [Clostridium sp.]
MHRWCISRGIIIAIIPMPWAMLPESYDVEILCHGKDRSGAVSGMFTLIRKLIQAVVFGLFVIALGLMDLMVH